MRRALVLLVGACLLPGCGRGEAEGPEFRLTERSGRTVTGDDLAGKVWVADFIFTSCPSSCPLMTAQMKRLQDKFGAHPDVRLVSFTVDPDRDTLPVLRDFARRYQASDRWFFLRGPAADVHHLATEGFRLGDKKDPLNHSLRLVLVDRKGRIRSYYAGDDEEAMERLHRDLRALLGTP